MSEATKSPVTLPGTRTELVVTCEAERCVGCHACETACKVWRDVPIGLFNRRIEKRWQGPEGQSEAVRLHFTSVACRHCAEPACMAACRYDAISKNADGVVVVNQARCVGCRTCKAACPFDVPQFRNFGGSRRMRKCDLCVNEPASPVATGNPVPPCVETCPTGALVLERLTPDEKREREQALRRWLDTSIL